MITVAFATSSIAWAQTYTTSRLPRRGRHVSQRRSESARRRRRQLRRTWYRSRRLRGGGRGHSLRSTFRGRAPMAPSPSGSRPREPLWAFTSTRPTLNTGSFCSMANTQPLTSPGKAGTNPTGMSPSGEIVGSIQRGRGLQRLPQFHTVADRPVHRFRSTRGVW